NRPFGEGALILKQNRGRLRTKIFTTLLLTLVTQAGELRAQTFGPGTIGQVSGTTSVLQPLARFFRRVTMTFRHLAGLSNWEDDLTLQSIGTLSSHRRN